MTESERTTAEDVIAAAQYQTSIPYERILHSTNAGLIVERTGTAKAEFRSEARGFARELAQYVTESQVGVSSVFVYEETFGNKDVVHWILHLVSLEAYSTMVKMGTADPRFRDIIFKQRVPDAKGGGTWDRIFIDGSISETVLLPQFMGMYGTSASGAGMKPSETKHGGMILPPAQHQSSAPPEETPNSATAGIIIHRTGQLKFDFRMEGRQFARAVADSINVSLPGLASAFVYEEAFGRADRIHWLIHLKDLSTYYSLISMHASMTPEIAELYTRQWISEEKGGGTWSRIFVDATLEDVALTPHNWSMYATKHPKEQS